MGERKDKARGKKKVSASSASGKKTSKKKSSTASSAKKTKKKTTTKKKAVSSESVEPKQLKSSEKKASKNPFAGLKQEVETSLQGSSGGVEGAENVGGNQSAAQNEEQENTTASETNETQGSVSKSKKSSKSPFTGLKENILTELKPSEASQEGTKKVDMAYLKSTVEESLKAPEKGKSVTLPRCPTGIEGFDEIVEGGLIKDSITLLCGGPGSGKSIFGMQTLVNGIEKYGENGVYITFEEDVETLLGDMKRFGWNLEEKMQNKQLSILAYSPEQVDRVLYIGGGPVREVIDEISAKRIVIDSITAFTMLYNSENQRRKALLSLFSIIKKWDCTALLTSEQTVKPEEHEAKIEEYQAEGIVYMYHTKKGDVRERSIEVFKMRGTNHSTKISPLKIGPGGIVVYPEESVY